MRIGKHDTAKRVFIIAEVGNNHEGDFGRAREMIAAAAQAGADAVKFQTITPERLVSALQTERIAQLSRFKFSQEQFAELAGLAQDNGLLFMSTPFDLEAVRLLAPLVPAFKIASPDNTFFPLIEAVASTGKPVLFSAGLCDRTELAASVAFLKSAWGAGEASDVSDRLALLHCVSAYPTPDDQAGLAAIPRLSGYGATPGYSDHTLGVDAAVLSVALGARIVEKHFTLDKTREGFRDHQLSADPADMAAMVRRIRQAEAMLGTPQVCCAPCEEAGRVAYRRSIVAAVDLPPGTVLGPEHLDWVRPGGGLPPGHERALIGQTLRAAKKRGEQILVEDVT
ncbi:MAG: N-acetylneuraminate synthase family protein [Humidesulfovibrio sp.]|uniref:N-acetylneuraminate synthase family protein n=1 Tax=Humidesulfovibrio sp. TaxID=2910988 RepID=UPI0027EFA6CE|nr:N-acetylneuraminate synthase family protein [Humidesulfovibrio sp.]MDQ7834247.1 N-acetylneuraminate synthase family protein [Humidesulfovibrio sp.]